MGTVPVIGKDWRDEEWARNVRTLDKPERTRRISAVRVLLDNNTQISDPLYSELVILLDALQGAEHPAGE